MIIGAEKTATTMVAAALREHPDADVPPEEFCGFADPNYNSGTPDALEREFTDGSSRLRVFKCAVYLGHDEVPERLARDLEIPELIVVLCDPIRRAVSAWYWYVRLGFLPPISHEVGLRQLLDGDLYSAAWQTPHSPTGWIPAEIGRESVLEWGLYARLLEPWLAVFPRERLHFLTDLDLSKNAAGAIQDLYGSLGLAATVTPTAQDHRYNEGIYSLRRLRWLRRRLPLMWQQDDQGRWFTNRPSRPLPALANAACVGIDRYVLARLEEPASPRIEQDLHEALRKYYDEDVANLQDLLRVDLTRWRS